MTLFLNYQPKRLKAPTLTIDNESIKLFGSDDMDYLEGLAKYIYLYGADTVYTNAEKIVNYAQIVNNILKNNYNYETEITISKVDN